METPNASKRNPLIPLIYVGGIGLALLAVNHQKLESTSKPLMRPDVSISHARKTHATEPQAAISRSPATTGPTSTAPEAHAFGFELLKMGLWEQAEPVLSGACDTGDLTSCQVLADEYDRIGRHLDAESRYATACLGGQLLGCRSLLDRAASSQTWQKAAISKLEQVCLDQENGSACQLLADSRWAKAEAQRVRRYRGLACSRGIDSSCQRSVAANY